MAITTLDQLVSNCRPPQFFFKNVTGTSSVNTRFSSTFNASGWPGAGVISTAGLAGEALVAPVAGQIPFTNPTGSNKVYIARLVVNPRAKVMLFLCDRVWQNSGFSVTTTATQTFNTANFNRDINNATGVGEGIQIGVEYYSAVSSTATITVTYTNSAGTPSRTTSATLNASMTTCNFLPFPLQAGDTGVRSIQSASISAAAASGTVSFVAYRVITTAGNNTSDSTISTDSVTGGMPEVFPDSVPFFIGMNNIGPYQMLGSVTFAEG